MTIGALHEPMGHPKVQGFLDRVPAVYAAADSSEGFQNRSHRDMGTFQHSWGPTVVPKCFGLLDPAQAPTTLSLWDDLESVAAFAYHGAHGEAMGKRKEWFESHSAPTYVAWWVDDVTNLSWQEAADRLDYLHEHGSTPRAFNFVKPFGADGEPRTLDAALVKSKFQANAALQLQPVAGGQQETI